MHEELKLEGSIPVLDDEAIEKLLRADLQQTLRNQEQAAAQAQEGLNYQRSDGTVVHAESAEAAIRMCPVLGKMALEDPEKVDALLMLAEIADEDFDFSDEPNEQFIEESHKEPVAAVRPAVSTETQTHTVENVRRQVIAVKEFTPQAQADQVVQQVREEIDMVHRQATIVEQIDTAIATPVATMSVDAPPLQRVVEGGNRNESPATLSENALRPIHQAVAVVVDMSTELSQPTDSTPVIHTEKVNQKDTREGHAYRPAIEPEPSLLASAKQIESHSSVPIVTSLQAMQPRPIPQPAEAVPTEPEPAMGTIVEANEPNTGLNIEPTPIAEVDIVTESPSKQASQIVRTETVQSPQTFHEGEGPREVVTQSQEILERIETAPLEVVLADVGRFMSQETAFETGENTIEAAQKVEEFQAVVQDIESFLHKITSEIVDGTGNDSIDNMQLHDPAVKQELTDQVIRLFRTLGYEQPDAHIRQLLDSYDTIFLMQSLENMCQMANGSKKLGRILSDSSYRQTRISQQITAYIKQLLSQQLLQS